MDEVTTFLSDPVGYIVAFGAIIAAAIQTYRVSGLGKALSGAFTGIANLKASMSRSSTMVTVPDELLDTPDAWRMSDPTWSLISMNLGALEKAKLRNVIDQNEGATPPVSCYELHTTKGTYTILNGAVDSIEALDIPSTSATVDPGDAEIFRVWGGVSSSAGNVPKRQATEMTIEMDNRSLFVSVKPTEVGGVTLGLFADGKVFKKILCDLQANDMDQAENDISFPTYDIQIPKEIIQEAQETDKTFDLVVAVAKGGKWYFQNDDSIIPWEKTVAIKVTTE